MGDRSPQLWAMGSPANGERCLEVLRTSGGSVSRGLSSQGGFVAPRCAALDSIKETRSIVTAEPFTPRWKLLRTAHGVRGRGSGCGFQSFIIFYQINTSQEEEPGRVCRRASPPSSDPGGLVTLQVRFIHRLALTAESWGLDSHMREFLAPSVKKLA